MSRVCPAFAEPDQPSDTRHDREQPDRDPDNCHPEFYVEERNEKFEVIRQAVGGHCHRHIRREVTVREIADLFSTLGNGEGADRHVEPSLSKPIKISAEVSLAKFEIELEFIGNLSPQFDADAGPGAVGVLNIEWGAGSD